MKKHVLMTAILSLAMTSAYAAKSAAVDTEVDAEIDQMYSHRAAPTAVSAGAIAPTGNTSGQPIYILNQATPTANAEASNQNSGQALAQQAQVQKQPTTVIEASPLKKSRADQIREARQQVEADTESKIVEKLEVSRMEDEKRRADVLFGEKFNQVGQQQQVIVAPAPVAVVAPAPAPAPVVVATPVAVVEPVTPAPTKEDTRDVVREEIRTALDAEKKPATTSQKYVSALAGVGSYPDVSNVTGNYLLGATFGARFEDAYAIEGSFIYSDYTVKKVDGVGYYYSNYYAPTLIDVHQYGMGVAVKYYLLNGVVRPIIGAAAQYSYRTFQWSADNNYGYSNGGGSDASSQALDVGVVTGADFEFSPKFSLGADFRYLFNVTSKTSQSNSTQFLGSQAYGTPIEKLQYWNLSLAAKMSF